MVTDAHTHLLPHRLATAVRKVFDDHMPGSLAYGIDHRQILDRLQADGVGRVWNLPYVRRPGVAALLNQTFSTISQDLSDHGVQVIPGCTVHPADDDPAGELRRAVAEGAKVCKLHCSVGDFGVDDPRLGEVFNQAAALELPVVVHVGHAVSGHTDADELRPLGPVAARHPDTTIIIAHLGHLAHRTALDLMAVHGNLWGDLTPVVFDLVPLTADQAVRFSDRLLFGSDAPNTGHTVGQQLRRLDALSLPDDVHLAITQTNATRLLA
jgi:predicted TIM-barrel fold metal-dependent hydrolase